LLCARYEVIPKLRMCTKMTQQIVQIHQVAHDALKVAILKSVRRYEAPYPLAQET